MTSAIIRRAFRAVPMLSTAALLGCGSSSPADVVDPGLLEFSAVRISLGEERVATVDIRNPGGMPVGPVTLVTSPVLGLSGALPGAELILTPPEISTLNPGQSRTVELQVSLSGSVQPGTYATSITAMAPSDGQSEGPLEKVMPVDFEVAEFEAVEGVASVTLSMPAGDLRQGDAVPFTVEARGSDGSILEGVAVGWKVLPAGAAYVSALGQVVPYDASDIQVVAQVGLLADTVTVGVQPRGLVGDLVRVGEGWQQNRRTSDLWVHGDFAYLGTHVGGAGGNTMFTWDVSNPLLPFKTDSVRIDARVVNDVKVSADGKLGVITHEGAGDGLNGVTLLDLEDPARPQVITRFTDQLETGVHNAWIEGDYLYLVADGSGVGLRVLDISDPANPSLVSTFVGSQTTFLHDVYVRDGLAFLSHWNAGLIVLDVGNGMMGGSPENPVEVSRIRTAGGQTHNAWYWPEGGYVFVGEEDFQTPGIMHVVDFRNPTAPVEVATFTVPGHTPHNFWMDEDRAVLYLAWYSNGVRVLDVSGELMGELEKQGREITSELHLGANGCNISTCTWAPQLHRGYVFVSDQSRGLSVLEPVF